MYKLLHSLTVTELLKQQLLPFMLAFVVAELFYKFHSFALECAAFLLTWYLLDAVGQLLVSRRRGGGGDAPAP